MKRILCSSITEMSTPRSILSSQQHKFIRVAGMMKNSGFQDSQIRVLLANSKPMEAQLLAGALTHQGFEVLPCATDVARVLEVADGTRVDVAVLSCAGTSGELPELTVLRALHFSKPSIPKVILLEADDRELVVHAFRTGARGLFCLADSSFQRFCDCIRAVHHGEVWATTQHLNYLLDSVCQTPALRVVSASGETLLTSREEQVVALVADGLCNRDVASELGLSEHTVKKYLFRIFEKLGISNRVELVLYAVHHGAPQATQWIA